MDVFEGRGGVEDLHDEFDRVAYMMSEESVTPAPPVSRPPMCLKPSLMTVPGLPLVEKTPEWLS